jgi:hypothetical protein
VVATGSINANSLAIGASVVSPLTVYSAGGVKQLGILDATRAQIVDGSAAAPVTALGPSVLVSRYETLGSFSDQNAAIFGASVGSPTSLGQPVAIQGFAYQAGLSDAVALFGRAEMHGSGGHAAIAGFTAAVAYTSGSGAIAFQTETTNFTGQNAPYFADLTGKQIMIGWDVNYDGTVSANLGTVGVNIRAINARWDVGLGFQRYGGFSPTKTADIQTDSDAVTILLANSGAHTDGINLTGTGSTYSGSAFKSPGFLVSGAGVLSVSGLAAVGVINANAPTGFSIAMPSGAGGIDFAGGSTIFRNVGTGALTLTSQTNVVELPAIDVALDRGHTTTNQTSAAAGAAGTLTNAPTAGNPAFWLKVKINGTNYATPMWLG